MSELSHHGPLYTVRTAGHAVVRFCTGSFWSHASLGRLAALALAAFLLYQVWDYLAPHKPQLGAPLRQLADQVTPKAVDDLRALGLPVHRVAVLHLANDPSDYITDDLRNALEGNNIFDQPGPTIGEKIRDALRLRQPSYDAVGRAVAAGRSMRVDGVLFGRVNTLDSSADGDSRIDLELHLADVADGRVLFSRHYAEHAGGGPVAAAAEQLHNATHIQRVIAWVVIVLLLPVFTISFIRTMVRRESNRSNGFTLGIYTMVDTLLAYLLLGVSVAAGASWIVFAVAVTLAFLYNVHIMSVALRLEN